MNTVPLKGLALFLVLAGIFLTFAGTLTALVTGDRRLMLMTATGCFLQIAGWRCHRRQAGGAA